MAGNRGVGLIAMTKEELWSAYVRKNPAFERDGVITMPAPGLRKLFDQTWDRAHEQGFANGKAWQSARSAKSNPFSDIFGNG
jgi:hypothetical protein